MGRHPFEVGGGRGPLLPCHPFSFVVYPNLAGRWSPRKWIDYSPVNLSV